MHPLRFTKTLLIPVLLAGCCLIWGCGQNTNASVDPDSGASPQQDNNDGSVLIFSKTKGYYHESIPDGIAAIRKLGTDKGFKVDTTKDASKFTAENLKKYKAIIFLSTTLDVLDDEQQKAMESYIKGGGGFVGVHAAADTEYDWPWYNKLVGAYFKSHPNNPNVRKASVHVIDKKHPATESLPEKWERSDEWYNYKDINPDLKVLAKLDEKSYEGGENGDNHPIIWYHEYDGGRAFYTGGGHTKESFSDPVFMQHLLGGIEYAMGEE
ncbi:MAG: ThuA domain-containing protein [Chryseosolibacter sp.]